MYFYYILCFVKYKIHFWIKLFSSVYLHLENPIISEKDMNLQEFNI